MQCRGDLEGKLAPTRPAGDVAAARVREPAARDSRGDVREAVGVDAIVA